MSGAGGSQNSSGNTSVQEYKIRVPKNARKQYHVMRFNATLNVNFNDWNSTVKMERENNMKEFKGLEEEQPKFGAGSEFGRELKEEARRKKFGIVAKKYKPEDQPWILKAGGKGGKKFKGIREGGVSENAAFYVFTHGPDGVIDAYPLKEWYNFQPIQRYKALSAEEAEQEFGRRNKVMNYFSLMMRKRLKPDENPEAEDPDEAKTKKSSSKNKSKDLKISEMDEWMDSDDESSDSDEDKEKKNDSDGDSKKGKGKNKKGEAAKKKKKKVNDEAFEESDDGDEEGRELDYISDSSDSDTDHEGKANKELKSVAEEDALRKLLTSDEDSEEEKNKSGEESNKDEENADKDAKDKDNKEKKDVKDKKKNPKKRKKDDKKDSSDNFSSDSSDSDSDRKKSQTKRFKENNSAPNSRSGSPSLTQSAQSSQGNNDSLAKKPRMENMSTFNTASNDTGITEDAVRRYLMRKPMTTTELLTKFKSKKTGVSSDKLVEMMTQILKRINPIKQTIKGKMYLSIKS
ncbi:general transcription factor IIF subunit 1 isoform X2 [Ctenocephalides felis]|uniref:general transcription factor IIF subunit 1 isoform X2 n=1 Tax=Ctenocephalides felis TaxID=7515 RepID=UPI000E6E47BA|nr:general transcription factor IIF subunit 1 isoform X2 [Ctenocephalides felis]